jgi:hypothetical protein
MFGLFIIIPSFAYSLGQANLGYVLVEMQVVIRTPSRLSTFLLIHHNYYRDAVVLNLSSDRADQLLVALVY